MWHSWRGLSREEWKDRARPAGPQLPQVRKRFIRYKAIAEGFWIGGDTTAAVVGQAITPAAITSSSDVTAAVVAQRRIAPASITSTSNVSASVAALRAITASINATSALSAALSFLRAIAASIAASSDVTASVSVQAVGGGSEGLLATWRGLSFESWSDIASTSGGLSGVPQVRRRLIRRRGISEGFYFEILDAVPGTKAVAPAAVNATSTVTATVVRLRPIAPASITVTSNVTASITTATPVAPPPPTWSPFVDDRRARWGEYDPSDTSPRLTPQKVR